MYGAEDYLKAKLLFNLHFLHISLKDALRLVNNTVAAFDA